MMTTSLPAGIVQHESATIAGASITNFEILQFGVPPVEPNDNQVFSDGVYLVSVAVNSNDPAIVTFPVLESGSGPGAHEHDFLLSLEVDTPERWPTVYIVLGSVEEDVFIQDSPEGLDFDTPDKDSTFSNGDYTLDNHTSDTLEWSAINLPGSPTIFIITIDVPQINEDFSLYIGPSLPEIPEPTTASILVFSSLLLGKRRQRFANQ